MKAPLPEVRPLTVEETEDLLKRAEAGNLTPDDVEIIRQTFHTLAYIISLLHQKKAQVKILLKRIFGIKSEKSQKLQERLKQGTTPDNPASFFDGNDSEAAMMDKSTASGDPSVKEKPKGHGRNGVET